MLNYNVNFSDIQERIEKEQILLGVAKKIKEWSNASEKACIIFAKYSLEYLATTTSGYSMGEYIYFAFKGNRFAFIDNTHKKKLITNDDLDYSTSTVTHIKLKDFLLMNSLEEI
jgi:hypothetical protein